MAQKVRIAADKALKEVYQEDGIEGLKCALVAVLEVDGPSRFFDVLSKYCPKEIDIQGEGENRILVVGKPPDDMLEWAKQQNLPAPVTIDNETGDPVLPAPADD